MMRRLSSSSITSAIFQGFARRASIQRLNLPRFYSDQSQSSLSRRLGPLTQYRNLVEQGKLQHDPYQEKLALELEGLLGRLQQYEKDMEEYHAKLAKWEENRESECRRLLMEEAESKQQSGIWTSVNKHRDQIINRLKSW